MHASHTSSSPRSAPREPRSAPALPQRPLTQRGGPAQAKGVARGRAARQAVAAAGAAGAAPAPAADAPAAAEAPAARKAHAVVQRYYAAYNARDLPAILATFSDDVSYTDTTFAAPYKGKAALRGFFEEACSAVPPDLRFVVDELTTGEGVPGSVGATWHVEVGEGVKFPFSRGASFYKVDAQGRICSAFDVVEPAVKPGSGAFQALRLLAPLVRKLGDRADPANARIPWRAAAVWLFYAGGPSQPTSHPVIVRSARLLRLQLADYSYVGAIFFSSSLPGKPILQTPPGVFQEIFYESLDFFYVNMLLSHFGLPAVPSVPTPPTSLALFQFVNAWSLMLLPVMLADPQGAHLKHRRRWWFGTQFVTNVFFIPYMALREAPPEGVAVPQGADRAALPRWAPAVGATALAVVAASGYWVLFGRPEVGGWGARWEYLLHDVATNRAEFAFVLDTLLYSCFQAVLLRGAKPWQRFTPFFGMAAWLLEGRRRAV